MKHKPEKWWFFITSTPEAFFLAIKRSLFFFYFFVSFRFFIIFSLFVHSLYAFEYIGNLNFQSCIDYEFAFASNVVSFQLNSIELNSIQFTCSASFRLTSYLCLHHFRSYFIFSTFVLILNENHILYINFYAFILSRRWFELLAFLSHFKHHWIYLRIFFFSRKRKIHDIVKTTENFLAMLQARINDIILNTLRK